MEQHHIQRDLHKKMMFQKRQFPPPFGIPGGPADDEEPPTKGPVVPPTTTSSTTPIIRGPTSTPGPITISSTTSTSATTSSSTTNPLSISIPGLTSSSSTTSSRALTTSASTSSTTSSTTSSSSSSSTTPLVTQSRNVATITQGGTITQVTTTHPTGSMTVSSAAASSTTTPENTSNTGTIVGGIFGAIVGIAVLACVIAFVIRKLRQRRLDEEHFDAAQFRNSAMVIEDDAPIVHNDAVAAGYNNGGRNFGARPPTMIERHMANSPALPVAAYGAYGAAQVNQYPDYGYEPQQQYHGMPTHDMNNFGNPFSPSDPMVDQRGGQGMYGQQPVYGYENPAQYHPQQQQYVDMERVTSPGRVHSPPHPTEFSTVPEAAAHPTALTPGQNIPPQSQVQGSPVQTPPAQTTPQSQQEREPAPAAGAKRPETIYNEDDAYGGM